MVTIVGDRIPDTVKKGITLEQVKASQPTLDYDDLYGSDTGPWTTDMFIEAVYRDLRRSNAKSRQPSKVTHPANWSANVGAQSMKLRRLPLLACATRLALFGSCAAPLKGAREATARQPAAVSPRPPPSSTSPAIG